MKVKPNCTPLETSLPVPALGSLGSAAAIVEDHKTFVKKLRESKTQLHTFGGVLASCRPWLGICCCKSWKLWKRLKPLTWNWNGGMENVFGSRQFRRFPTSWYIQYILHASASGRFRLPYFGASLIHPGWGSWACHRPLKGPTQRKRTGNREYSNITQRLLQMIELIHPPPPPPPPPPPHPPLLPPALPIKKFRHEDEAT